MYTGIQLLSGKEFEVKAYEHKVLFVSNEPDFQSSIWVISTNMISRIYSFRKKFRYEVNEMKFFYIRCLMM